MDKNHLLNRFFSQGFVLAAILLISLMALLLAYGSEYFFNLLPCQFCLYERYIYMAATIVSIAFFASRKFQKVAPTTIFGGTISVLFFVSVVVTGYHVAIERGWVSSPSVCSSSLKLSGNLERITETLLSTPLVRCDIVPFRFLGLSMAEYNLMLSFMLFLFVTLSLTRWMKRKSP